MIQLETREEIFNHYPKIAKEIAKVQNLFFDDDIEYFESEEHRLDYIASYDVRYLDKQVQKPIYKIISFEYSDINTFTKALSQKLQQLFEELNIKELIIIGDIKSNLFGNLNNGYTPLVSAYNQLYKITKTWNYSDAITFDLENLPRLIDIFFWKERCDAAAPEYIFFFDKQERLGFFICKDGNIHTIEFDNEIISTEFLKRHNWHQIDGRCYDKFSVDRRIEEEKQ